MPDRRPMPVLLILIGLIAALPQVDAAQGPARIAVTDQGGLRVDGKPFVPIFAWAVPRKQVGFNHDLGLNCITPGRDQFSLELLDELHAKDMMCLVDAGNYSDAVAAHPALLAWRFGDEPDMSGKKAPDFTRAYAELKAKDPAHPIWINLTSRFYKTYYQGDKPGTKWPNREQYRAFAEVCDIISYDHYPVTGYNKPQRVPELYHATADFVDLIPADTHWVIVESADQDLSWTAKKTRGPTPDETRAEVWMAIVGGAKGIGYFHIAFNPFRWENLTREMKQELPRINALVTEVAGAIAEGELLAHAADDRIAYRILRHDGGTHVFAVNLTREPQRAVIPVPDAPRTARAAVVHEDRHVTLDDGSISDDFAPLGVHVYRLGER